VSHRPLVFVSGLTVGDYLLWNWSLNGNHDVIALVSGLTLPPLAVACLWLLAVSFARLFAGRTRRSRGAAAQAGRRPDAEPRGAQAPAGAPLEEASSSTGTGGRSSGRLAA
jgi:hypothetical protein